MIALAAAALSVALAGCTPSQYAQLADKSAYATAASARKAVLGVPGEFDAAYRPFCPMTNEANCPIQVGQKVIRIGVGEPQKLTLDECLEIAFRNSRSFQTRKETLYAAALDVSGARRDWNFTKFGGGVSGSTTQTVVGKQGTVYGGDSSGNLSFAEKFFDGGLATLGASIDMASDLLGWRTSTVGSLVSANFTQPLLRGAWRGLAYEEQYRKERDFLFAVFDYERFTQTFSADAVSRYCAVLQARDQLENGRQNIERLKKTLELTKVLVAGGQRSRIEQDQAEQRLLDAEVRYEQNEQSYRDSLDQFKLFLGLPIRANVETDYPSALEAMSKAGPQPVDLDEAGAIETALWARPDVLTQRAVARDAQRDVQIAADAFLPQVDLTLGISATGLPPRDFDRIRTEQQTRQMMLKANYNLDQTENRDKFRKAMIAADKANRDLTEFLDKVCLDVRQSYRSLLQSRRTYELQLRSVELAKRRQKLAVLEQRAGQASARDVLDAEDALNNAQNGLTSALVDYTTTRLKFLAGLGLIAVDDKGRILERAQPQRFDRIARPYPYVVGR